LDVDNSVQYAIAIPPVKNCSTDLPGGKCPIIITTHGAGSIPEWLLPYYPRQEYAWTLSSEGRSMYGYDWTGPQFINAMTSAQALAQLISRIEVFSNQQINLERIVFTGHSMGGHGCYLLATHFSDYMLGATCAAGWIKFENYIPTFLK
jgi:predicted peptidase